MSFVGGLRIAAVVMLGLVVASAARVIFMSISGHDRVTTRSLVGEALSGMGAFVIGWGLLPGGTSSGETTMVIVGSLIWVLGALVSPVQRVSPGA